jgi:hypothetical protein
MQSQEFCADSANVRREVGNSLFHNAYAFADFYDSVASDVFEALHEAARPTNLGGIGHGGFAQPKMQAEVTLRDVSPPPRTSCVCW